MQQELPLNEDQQRGYDALMAFYKSPEQNQMFCLRGYAGTGKTFLLSRFVADLLKQNATRDYFDRISIAMTAPTNKAVQVLRESSGRQDVTFKTIHSLLGLKEVIRDSGEIDFEKAFDDHNDFGRFSVVIIDEVSMLDDKLFLEVKRFNNQVKIIFTGDPAQIPPVGKIDCEPFLRPDHHGIISFQLTRIMRQADGSSIISNSFALRNDLSNEEPEFEEGGDVILLSAASDRDRLRQMFTNIFDDVSVSDNTKVIAWTNRKVGDYNRYIRALLFGPSAPKLMKGERLVMNSPHPSNFDTTDKEGKKPKKRSNYELLTTNQEITVTGFGFELMTLEGHSFYCYITDITFTNNAGRTATGRVKIMHEDSEAAFRSALEKIKKQAIAAAPHERRAIWKRFYDLLRSVADVSYAYAITAHKSQGSTYATTFVDAANIMLNSNVVERNRILYTALTRAKNEVTLIV